MIADIVEQYPRFKNSDFNQRYFHPQEIYKHLQQLPKAFKVTEAGKSIEGRSIYALQWGIGKTKVFLWSQMHGDEPTGTLALLDLFNFLQDPQFKNDTHILSQQCSLHFLPLVNPDGALRFCRRNSQQIDLNRDFLQAQSLEAQLLKNMAQSLQADFGFNLHDQTSLWSVAPQGLPATLSLLAPAFNFSKDLNEPRLRAMQVISRMFKSVSPLLPHQIGLFDDDYEQRAFGDNFQKNGMSTILIEGGGYFGDPEKQEVRKYFFLAMLSGLMSIAKVDYLQEKSHDYFNIPQNSKQLYHKIFRAVNVNGISTDLALNFEWHYNPEIQQIEHIYTVKDIGDLHPFRAYEEYHGGHIGDNVILEELAHFTYQPTGGEKIVFNSGRLI